MNIIPIQGGKLAQNKLQEKMIMIKKFKEEIRPEKQKLAQELRDLFNCTQAIESIQNITEEEISAEIEAYGRGQ